MSFFDTNLLFPTQQKQISAKYTQNIGELCQLTYNWQLIIFNLKLVMFGYAKSFFIFLLLKS